MTHVANIQRYKQYILIGFRPGNDKIIDQVNCITKIDPNQNDVNCKVKRKTLFCCQVQIVLADTKEVNLLLLRFKAKVDSIKMKRIFCVLLSMFLVNFNVGFDALDIAADLEKVKLVKTQFFHISSIFF